MWNSARYANATANLLYAAALALIAYTGSRVLFQSQAFSLRTVVIGGELQHVTRSEIVNALQGGVAGTIFTVDLEAVRALFESVPWVRRADVRRGWPDRLEVRIEEHVALARWSQGSEQRLVNTHGELFSGRVDVPLPVFSGPDGSESEVARRYAAFRELLAPLALEPRQVVLNSRFAWQLRLSDGLTVQLGRDSDRDRVEDRLAKFVSVYPQTLGRSESRLDYVDLRYPNGFSLRVPEVRKSETQKPARKQI